MAIKIPYYSYWKEVLLATKSLAREAMEQTDGDREAAEDLINDSMLHEYVNDHQWIIFNGYNLNVIKFSDNADYYVDNFGADCAGEELKTNGLSGLHTAIAFWCMYADIRDRISDALDDAEAKHESEEENDE